MTEMSELITALTEAGVPAWGQLAIIVGTPLVVGVIGSSWITQLVVGSHEQRARLSERKFADTSAAAKALRKYRAAVLTYANEVPGTTPDHDRDERLAVLGSDVLVQCTMVKAGALLDDTELYLQTAELVAAQDPLTGTEEELSAFRTLLTDVATERKKA
ncbi:hypothetical protein NY537_05420 [Curtobacterium flaccumfaciens pv. betae]|uniref:hypothetical protein n=2 Tax=Curtobacterium TaxID=2034 RepID=UPI002658E4DC|nr:hypothetical protein [Curtobacterium flaccumfaciens]MCS5512187.1 hypothetical protein [Curtobacterium flaccumfaciens pv. betae]